MPRIALLLLVACSHQSPPVRPTSATPSTVPTLEPVVAGDDDDDDDDPDQECGRYHTLFARLDACVQLPEDDRRWLVQQDLEMLARRSESGMDDSSPHDTEAGCADGAALLMRVAAKACGW